jgi:RNA polymerase-interacting CarD/CdnL/TRCF family regulator
LSFTERKILTQVEHMLVAEIAVSLHVSEAHAERMIAAPKHNGKLSDMRKAKAAAG